MMLNVACTTAATSTRAAPMVIIFAQSIVALSMVCCSIIRRAPLGRLSFAYSQI